MVISTSKATRNGAYYCELMANGLVFVRCRASGFEGTFTREGKRDSFPVGVTAECMNLIKSF